MGSLSSCCKACWVAQTGPYKSPLLHDFYASMKASIPAVTRHTWLLQPPEHTFTAHPLPGLTFMRTSTLCLSASGDSHCPSFASWPASGTNRWWPSTSFRILTSWSCRQDAGREVRLAVRTHIPRQRRQHTHSHAEPSAHTYAGRAVSQNMHIQGLQTPPRASAGCLTQKT